MKKVLSLVLVIAMVLSSMSFAFAGTFSDTADSDYEKAIETLAALGVLSGYPDGTFGANRTITRAELAKVLVEALGYGELVTGASNVFPDTAGHWASGYIAIASGTGLVLGYPDGTFRPENPVTFDETYTMVIRALGYTDSVLSGNWPTNYKVKAIDLDLNDDVVMAKAQADRGAVAQIFYNTLEEKMVEIDEDGIAVPATPEKLFIDNIATPDKSFDVTPDTIDPDHKKYAGEVVDLAPYMYQNLSVYLNDDDQVVYVKGSNNLVLEGKLNHADDLTNEDVIVYNADKDKDYTFNIVTDSAFMVNGVETDQDNAEYNGEDVKVTVVLDAEDDDTLKSGYDIVGVVALKQTKVAQIDNVYVEGKDRIDGFDLPVDDDDEVDLENIFVKGDAESLEDIEEDDIVTEYKAYDDSKTTLYVSRETVEGKVTRVDGSSKYYIDGTKYNKNGLVSATWELADEGTFYLDHNGEIVVFSGDSAPTNYAVVVDTAYGTKVEDRYETSEYSIDDYPLIKLATTDDEVVSYEVAVEIDSDGSLDSSAELDDEDLLTTAVGGGNITFVAGTPAIGEIVEYAVDKDGRVSKIETVTQPELDEVDTEDLVFASDVIVFSNVAGDDFEVVDVERLKDTINGTNDYAVYNKSGEIEVLLTDDIDATSTEKYAYITLVNDAVNDGDEVQYVEAFMNGEEVTLYTDSETLFEDADVDTVSLIGFDGELISTEEAGVAYASNTTASAVYTSTGRVVFNNAGTDKGLYVASDATIITIEADDDVVLSDLYDIEEGESVLDIYVQDGKIVFIVIDER